MALADATISVVGAPHVVVVTIDHGLSPGSAQVAEQVATWARGRGAGAIVRRVEVFRRASIEAAAREARYRGLEMLIEELGIAWMLTGHTARDQAETVMMRIVRGTGPAGLAGIPVVRGPFVRPLLELPRDAIDAYVRAKQLPTWLDPMNADLVLARIRFRDQLLPQLRKENPALEPALTRLAASAREWLEVIDELAAPFASIPIDCPSLAVQHAAVRKRAVAIALEALGLGYEAVHLDQIDRLVTSTARGEVGLDIPGARVVRTYDRLTVVGPQPDAGPLGQPHAGPRGQPHAGPLGQPYAGPRGQPHAGPLGQPHAGGPDLVLPAGPYELRTWRAGDRMCPTRLRGRTRKLSDLFIDAKVPRSLRRNARVLVRLTDEVIVWAEHLGIAFGESPSVIPAPTRLGGSF
ncbi:MAG: tRNA(Ile)-lysidine synthetase [Myxococcales bacterium]|nr:tRNA(Ile)-lysidine synthetase [Myxococcales bacterium]